uniref:Replicase protein n=1 Tax=Porcine parvovirus 4 TaxID=707546 RepID=A0A6G5P6W1_9VIRU|nr:replicase protein [Porcine parvovirus 4]
METYWTGICRLFPDVLKIPGVYEGRYIFEVPISTRDCMKWPDIFGNENNSENQQSGAAPSAPRENLNSNLVIAVRQAEALFRELQKELRKSCRLGVDPGIFMQLGEVDSKGGLHLHWCVSVSAGTPRDVLTIFKNTEKKVSLYYFGVEGLSFFVPHKNKHGAWKSTDEGFIYNYLLKKLPLKECLYAWTTIGGTIGDACLNTDKRKELLDNRQDPAVIEELSAPMYKCATGEKMLDIVQWLVDNNICSESRWENKNALSLYSLLATQAGGYMAKQCLRIAQQKLLKEKPLGLTLMEFKDMNALRRFQQEEGEMTFDNNRMHYIFAINNYDPKIASVIMYFWSMKQTGKRNCVWFYGPATTGKTNMAQAICHSSANYGNVNWNNANFPFQDIVGAQVGWWEEGKMTGDMVEAAKALLGGTALRIDRKYMQSIEVNSPPFLITSNVDTTIVQDGSFVGFEHQQPLEDRMIKFSFNMTLPGNFGLITSEEVKSFFRMGAKLAAQPDIMNCPIFKKGPASIRHLVPVGEIPPPKEMKHKRQPLYMRAGPDEIQVNPEELDHWFEEEAPKKKKQKTKNTATKNPTETVEIITETEFIPAPGKR